MPKSLNSSSNRSTAKCLHHNIPIQPFFKTRDEQSKTDTVV